MTYYTRLSKKQIGIIYRANKEGKISITDKMISFLYNDVAERSGLANNEALENACKAAKSAIDNIFAGNYEEAQNSLTDSFNYLMVRSEGYRKAYGIEM